MAFPKLFLLILSTLQASWLHISMYSGSLCLTPALRFRISFNVYLFLRQRDRDRERQKQRDRAWVREGQRGRETQNTKQALGSKLSAQSPMWVWNSQTVRSWPEPKWDASQLSHPGAPVLSILHCGWWTLITVVCPPSRLRPLASSSVLYISLLTLSSLRVPESTLLVSWCISHCSIQYKNLQYSLSLTWALGILLRWRHLLSL